MIKKLIYLKKPLVVGLLILMNWQSFFQLSFIAYWKINQTFLSSLYCENKDKPALHCDGNCYLKKQIQKAEQNEKEFPTAVLKRNLVDTISIITTSLELHLQAFLIEFSPTYCRYIGIFIANPAMKGIFHPPQIV